MNLDITEKQQSTCYSKIYQRINLLVKQKLPLGQGTSGIARPSLEHMKPAEQFLHAASLTCLNSGWNLPSGHGAGSSLPVQYLWRERGCFSDCLCLPTVFKS